MYEATKIFDVFAGCQWLWVDSAKNIDVDYYAQFRRFFTLKQIPEQAEIAITADSFYMLYVNGQYIHRGPARGFQSSWPYDRIDIASMLRIGANVIAVMVYRYGISTYSYINVSSMGHLLLAGNINGQDIRSGSGWRQRLAPGYMSMVARASKQQGFQEHCDNRSDPNFQWQEIRYDDSEWDKSEDTGGLKVAGIMPFFDIEDRGIPLLESHIVFGTGMVAQGMRTLSDDAWRNPQNITDLWVSEDWMMTDSGHVRYQNDNLLITGNREQAFTAVIDFSSEVTGTLILNAKNAYNGEVIDLLVCESISGFKPDIKSSITAGCKQALGARIILAEGNNYHEFAQFLGFRYLVVVRRGGNSEVELQLGIRQSRYPLDEQGKFECDNSVLSQLWQMARHTQRSCMSDAYVDCPWREQAQWWGDALVQARNTFYLAADARLLARGIRLIGRQRVPNGLTYSHAPTSAHASIIPDFSLCWIITHYSYYWQTGDLSLAREFENDIMEVLGYFHNRRNAEGLWYYDPRYWLFLDWCQELPRDNISTLLNMQYLWALQNARKLLELLNNQEAGQELRQREDELEVALTREIWDDKRQLPCDGIDKNGKLVRMTSPHIAAMSIILGIWPHTHRRLLDEVLLPLVNGNHDQGIVPTPFFMYYIFEALKLANENEAVISCMRRWWGEWLDAGLATTPETWTWNEGRGSWSLCHAWSAHVLVQCAEIILGVKQSEPGWQRITISPLMSRGGWAAGIIPTPYGNIEINWDWQQEIPVLKINMPARIEFDLPDNKLFRAAITISKSKQ